MKKNISIVSLTAILFFAFAACKNDFNIAANWKEIPIVYGLIDPNANVQYVKVYKAFLDQQKSALQMASNPDSIYYPNGYLKDVKLMGYDVNGILKQTFTLTLVDGDTVNLPMEAGTFASHPNLFYRLKSTGINKLNEVYKYKLEITKANGSILAAATTDVVGKSSCTQQNGTSGLSFIQTGKYNPKLKLTYNSEGVNSAATDFVMRIFYSEENVTTSHIDTFSVDWFYQTNVAVQDYNNKNFAPVDFSIDAAGFYQYLAYKLNNSTPLASNLKRSFVGISLITYAVNQTLVKYENVQKAQSGVTSGTVEPEYTNIINGLGLFASRSTTIHNYGNSYYTLNQQSLDSLKKGMYTSNLGFDR